MGGSGRGNGRGDPCTTPPSPDEPSTADAEQFTVHPAYTSTGVHNTIVECNVMVMVELMATNPATTLAIDETDVFTTTPVVEFDRSPTDTGAVTRNSVIKVPRMNTSDKSRALSASCFGAAADTAAATANDRSLFACATAFNALNSRGVKNDNPKPAHPTAMYMTRSRVTPAAAATSANSATAAGLAAKLAGSAWVTQPPRYTRVDAVLADGCTNGEAVAVGEAAGETVEAVVGVVEADPEAETVAAVAGVVEADPEAETVVAVAGVVEAVPEAEVVEEAVAVAVWVGVLTAVAVEDPERVTGEEAVADAVWVGVGDADRVREFVLHSLSETKYVFPEGTEATRS